MGMPMGRGGEGEEWGERERPGAPSYYRHKTWNRHHQCKGRLATMPKFDNPTEVDLDPTQIDQDDRPFPRELLTAIASDPALIEIGRRAIEDAAVDMRDMRAVVAGVGNGIVVTEEDGTRSSLIRVWTPDAIVIALRAIAAADSTEIATERELFHQQRESREQ